MTSNEILKADMLDILFDNRNKQYGAYALRKTYNGRLGMALGVSLSSILLLFFVMRIDNSTRTSRPPIDDGQVIVRTLDIPHDIKKIEPILPKPTIPAPKVRQTAFVNPVVIDDDKVKNTVPDQDQLLKGLISDVTTDGIDANNTVIVKENPPAENPAKDDSKSVVRETLPSREPEFPGGQKAWLNFLQNNLMAPSELEPGETKTVAIRFDVSEEGVVTNFHVMKSAGSAYDNEVIRVLRKMPKWKPAIQNGQPVARVFTQPVTFMGIEQ